MCLAAAVWKHITCTQHKNTITQQASTIAEHIRQRNSLSRKIFMRKNVKKNSKSLTQHKISDKATAHCKNSLTTTKCISLRRGTSWWQRRSSRRLWRSRRRRQLLHNGWMQEEVGVQSAGQKRASCPPLVRLTQKGKVTKRRGTGSLRLHKTQSGQWPNLNPAFSWFNYPHIDFFN